MDITCCMRKVRKNWKKSAQKREFSTGKNVGALKELTIGNFDCLILTVGLMIVGPTVGQRGRVGRETGL